MAIKDTSWGAAGRDCYRAAHGGLQDDLDAISDVLLRNYLESRFFREFDQGLEVAGEFVEDLQPRQGVEGVAAL